jgi:hypothetical protein
MFTGVLFSGAACALGPPSLLPPAAAAAPLLLCSICGYVQQILMPLAFKYAKAASAAT